MNAHRLFVTLAAVAATTGALVPPAIAADPRALSLGKGTDAASRAEAAELSYLSDAAKGTSYGVQAALIWAPQAQFGLGGKATWQWDLAIGKKKDTISGDNRVDKNTVALGGRWVLDLGGLDNMVGRAAMERRRNLLNDADDTALSATGRFNFQALKVSGNLPGGFGYDFKPIPFLGGYRSSTSGNTGTNAVNGHYGGVVAGFDLYTDLFKDGVKGSWVRLDVSARRQAERWVSGSFGKANYDFGSVGLRMPFATGGDAEGAVSLVHTRGTDRMGGVPWKRRTALTVTIRFGNA